MNNFENQKRTIKDEVKFQHPFLNTHYDLFGVHPSASFLEIRKAYRELSKLYHPDTTNLAPLVAKVKFQELNAIYDILSNPHQRMDYDRKIGYFSSGEISSSPVLNYPHYKDNTTNSVYLDIDDRQLSGGEIFALLLMAMTFFCCLFLAIFMAWWRMNH